MFTITWSDLFALVFILVSAAVKMTPFPEFHKKDPPDKGLGVFKYPQIILGVTALFWAVGAEVAIGSMLINFFGLEHIAGLNPSRASKYVAFYWGGLMIGRLCGAVSFFEMRSGKTSIIKKRLGLQVFTASDSTLSSFLRKVSLPVTLKLSLSALKLLKNHYQPTKTEFLSVDSDKNMAVLNKRVNDRILLNNLFI
ncbi:MAG: hypothetical protein AB2L20_11445 [Mangrovibacterium sp.]